VIVCDNVCDIICDNVCDIVCDDVCDIACDPVPIAVYFCHYLCIVEFLTWSMYIGCDMNVMKFNIV